MAAPGFGQREPFPGFPPPLTTRPEGLLSMLGLQTNGRYPQHLAMDWLTPQLDLLPWYLQSRAEILNASPFVSGMTPGTYVNIWQVPDGEVWIVLDATFQFTVATGSATGAFRLVRVRSTDTVSMLSLSEQCRTTTGSLSLVAFNQGVRGTLMRPSVRVGLFCEDGGTGGTTAGTATLRMVRCKF